ncbi:MAG: DUF937 domain-containing protein [Armatimonadetes bacterium]|nr:DUF937 domain-containing protein [Armatimonadota bacterium]
MNLIETLKRMLTPDMVGEASSAFAEPEGGVSKAFDGAIPAVLGGLVGRSGGADLLGIFEMFKSPAVMSGDEAQQAKTSSGFLKAVFGDKSGAVSGILAKSSGIKKASTGGILSLVGALVMKFFGNRVQNEGMPLPGLTSMLDDNRNSIVAALPAGVGSLLGLDSENESPMVAAVRDDYVVDTIPPAPGGTNWLVPILAGLVGLGVLGYVLTRDPDAAAPTAGGHQKPDPAALQTDAERDKILPPIPGANAKKGSGGKTVLGDKPK